MPPLPPEGPYFAFINQNDDTPVLTLLGADGIGRKDISLPEDADTGYNCSSCIISPDGEWLAFWTGTAGGYGDDNPLISGSPFDLQLNLLHIPDGETTKVTDLLSPDYPVNFERNAEDVSVLAETLSESFLDGIHSAVWSPDSRYLAFAGEMDGPSSDLYVYDSAEKTIRRLSSGSRNISFGARPAIRWSPDGKWIVYASTYTVGMGMTVRFYAARPDGSQAWDFPDEVTNWQGWVSSSQFLVGEDANGPGTYGLRMADLTTGLMLMIWRCPFQSFAYDPEGRLLVLDMSGDLSFDCPNPGLSMRAIPSLETLLFIGPGDPAAAGGLAFLGQGNKRFIASGLAGTYAITSEGEILWLTHEILEPYISPDRRWIAFAGGGFRLMDIYGNMSELLSDIPVSDLQWYPDSTGFLFRSGAKWYAASVPEGTVARIDGDELPSDVSERSYYLDYFWQPDSQGVFLNYKELLYFISLRNHSIRLILNDINDYFFDPIWMADPK
jgi:WD40 repeat protein